MSDLKAAKPSGSEAKSSAQIMPEWLREAADELDNSHAVLDAFFFPRIHPQLGGAEFTLAARIHFAIELEQSRKSRTAIFQPKVPLKAAATIEVGGEEYVAAEEYWSVAARCLEAEQQLEEKIREADRG